MSAGSDSSGSGSATNGSKRGVEDVHHAHEGGGGGDAETSRKKFKSEPSDRLEGLNLDTHAQGLFRCLMKTGDAGAIIGKGGSNINRLRKEYNVTVTVPNSMSVERVLTMKGRIQDIGDCLYDCFYLIHEDKGSQERGGSSSSGGDFKVETRMLIHSPYIGGLIGYKGERIKEIREKTRAEIKIYEDCCPGSTERVFKIDGATSDVVSCVMYTMHILNNTDVKTRGRHLVEYDPINSADLNDSEFRSRQVPAYGHGPRGFSDDVEAFGFGGAPGAFHSHPIHDAPVFLEDAGGPVQTISLTVAAESAGAIIGTGGRNINVARRRSGAEIKVEDGKHDGAPRQVTITGSEEQINYAKFLIQQFVREDRVVRYNSGGNRNQSGGKDHGGGGGGRRGGGGGSDRRGVGMGGGGGGRGSGHGLDHVRLKSERSSNSNNNSSGGASSRGMGSSSSAGASSFPAAASFVTPGPSAATATIPPLTHDPNSAYAAYSAAYYAAAAASGVPTQPGAPATQPPPPAVSGFYQQPANVATASVASPATSQLAMAASQYAAAAVAANSQPANAAAAAANTAAAAAFMPTMAAAYGAVYTPMAPPPTESALPQTPAQTHTALYQAGALSGYGY